MTIAFSVAYDPPAQRGRRALFRRLAPSDTACPSPPPTPFRDEGFASWTPSWPTWTPEAATQSSSSTGTPRPRTCGATSFRTSRRAGPRGHGRVGQDAGGLVPLRGPRPLPRRLVRRPPAGPERDPRRPRLGLGPRLPLGTPPSGAGAWDRLHGGARPPDDLAGMARAGAPDLSGHALAGRRGDRPGEKRLRRAPPARERDSRPRSRD